MEPYPLRLPESLKDDLQEEADQRDLDLAEYCRRILRNRQPDTMRDTQPDTAVVSELRDRLDVLEERVSTLEDTQADTKRDTQPTTDRDTQPDAGLRGRVHSTWPADGGYQETVPRVDAVERVVAQLRKRGQLTSGVVADLVAEDADVADASKLVKQVVDDWAEVETPTTGSNRWLWEDKSV